MISLGIDQDAQENFFHPERQDPRHTGAGGVPVRSADDYRAPYQASRRENFPLVRTYSGTDDFIELVEMYAKTVNIAWCAIPLFWFNQMDGRGPWDLEGSIREHQRVMAWHGARAPGGQHLPVNGAAPAYHPHRRAHRDRPRCYCRRRHRSRPHGAPCYREQMGQPDLTADPVVQERKAELV